MSQPIVSLPSYNVGIDLGNWSCHVLGDEDQIDFGLSKTNVYTYISQIKCLLGKKFSDPELQLELDNVPFKVIEGPNGYPLIHGRYKGEDRAFTPVEILAMLISSLKFEARADDDVLLCIGVPIYFTDQQKRDMIQAAKIAGFQNSFGLTVDDTTAMVLAYEKYFSSGPDGIVAFIDFGHASMQICLAEFKYCSSSNPRRRKKSVNILYKGHSRSLGGREFDKVLFQHFASNIRKKHNIDVYENSSACVRLREACERLKYDLSTYNEASFCMKNFSDSIDIKGSITRKDFENLSILILEKIEQALRKALSKSWLDIENIHFVEKVGKGCSIPAISNILTRMFGKRIIERTVYFEHIARGCMMEARKNIYYYFEDGKSVNRPGAEITQSTSSEIVFEVDEEDSQKYLWRKAMDEGGHLLTFLNEFLENNMDRIGRLEKTMDETYYLSKGNIAEFSYSDLQDATNNFHESFKLGEGGFGTVYKGILRNVTVAIKMLKKESSQGSKEFIQEVVILSKVSHPNLVKLIGTCVETCALIYEYLPNGNLEDRLRCKNNAPPLSWQERVRIAFEICLALSFLHSSKPHGIVHGDLKPDNVLLDSNNTSKICDFGLCRQLNWSVSASVPCHQTECPKGTLAYMDPEYLSIGKITPQYDVYSFGIILLRIVTCKEPRGLRYVVEEAQKKNLWKTLVDASASPWPFKEAKRMILLGLRCSDPVRKNRPDLSTKVFKEMKSMLDIASASGSS